MFFLFPHSFLIFIYPSYFMFFGLKKRERNNKKKNNNNKTPQKWKSKQTGKRPLWFKKKSKIKQNETKGSQRWGWVYFVSQLLLGWACSEVWVLFPVTVTGESYFPLLMGISCRVCFPSQYRDPNCTGLGGRQLPFLGTVSGYKSHALHLESNAVLLVCFSGQLFC